VNSSQFPERSVRRHLSAEIPYRLEVRGLHVPSVGRTLHGCEIRRAGEGATLQLHAKDALAVGSGRFTENAEAIVRQHALHDELPLLQFLPFDEIARRTFLGSPDHRHRLKILRADGREKLLHGRARCGRAGESTTGPRATRGECHDERDDRTLHDESPSYL
jgi:hypothetical protein